MWEIACSGHRPGILHMLLPPAMLILFGRLRTKSLYEVGLLP